MESEKDSRARDYAEVGRKILSPDQLPLGPSYERVMHDMYAVAYTYGTLDRNKVSYEEFKKQWEKNVENAKNNGGIL